MSENRSSATIHRANLTFTDRQLEALRLLARGFTFEEIGEELGISTRTAKAYSDLFRQRLGVEKRREIPEAYMRLTGDNPFTVEGRAA